jgi:hypothetical protein
LTDVPVSPALALACPWLVRAAIRPIGQARPAFAEDHGTCLDEKGEIGKR